MESDETGTIRMPGDPHLTSPGSPRARLKSEHSLTCQSVKVSKEIIKSVGDLGQCGGLWAGS